MMEENYCYYRPLTIVDNMIKDGLLGDVYYAESDYLMDFQMRPLFPHLGTWRDDVYFGRRGHPYITHTLGPLCFLMDSDIKKVSCLGAGKYGDLVADRTCVLMLETNNVYSDAGRTALDSALNTAKSNVQLATDSASLKLAIENGKKLMDDVATKAQEDKITALRSYYEGICVGKDNDVKEQLAQKLESGEKAIKDANDNESIELAFENCKTEMNAVIGADN
jgi:predicted dehydrogenase